MTDVVMPQMGESLAEGTVVRWLKKTGDRIERDEPLFEISTDKVDTDVPSPVAGTLQRILVQEGETVAVGARVAVIDDGTAAASAIPEAASHAKADQPGHAEEPAGHFKNAHAPQLVSFRRDPAPQAAAAAASNARTFTPAVLESARRGGVPLQALTSLSGSGRGGRVTKADMARLIESGGASRGPAPASGAG